MLVHGVRRSQGRRREQPISREEGETSWRRQQGDVQYQECRDTLGLGTNEIGHLGVKENVLPINKDIAQLVECYNFGKETTQCNTGMEVNPLNFSMGTLQEVPIKQGRNRLLISSKCRGSVRSSRQSLSSSAPSNAPKKTTVL
ncbi:hypothetical protein LIER_40025 [Lithospermum erythrorhizon]|uniref:Uncharacterized protein n=1 Tax=Lithospermum erythrorhizon TaxID=34254 RepID=A0AAV3QSM4_LITER